MATKGTTHHRSGAKADGKAADAQHAPHQTAHNVTPEEATFLDEHADALSKSTLRARWIHSEDEHEDRPGQTLATQSHQVIMHWAEERGGVPATVSGASDGRPRVLRIDFQAKDGSRLQRIDWEEWFAPFDERQLVFLYQEHKRDGQQSNFFRLDNPKREDG